MSAEDSLLSQPFDDGVIGALEARLGRHNQAKFGPASDSKGMHGRRLSAWCYITHPNGPTLSMTTAGFQKRYREGDRMPQPASLKKVTINRVTTTAEKINLTVEVKVEFECYTIEQFFEYADAYLRRPPEAQPITVRFGNIEPSDGRGTGPHELKGTIVIGGGYTQEGSIWKCTFKAISPGSAVTQVDMMQVGDKIPRGLTFKAARILQTSSPEKVAHLHEYILYHLQRNGNVLTEDVKDGEEISISTPGFTNPIGKVYKQFKGDAATGNSTFNKIVAWKHMFSDDSVGIDTGANEYVSLKYITELVNKTVLGSVNEKAIGYDLKIIVDENAYSFVPSYLFKSANPLEVLFLDGSVAGKYIAKQSRNTGKDFEVGGKFFAKCKRGGRIYLSKILISRRTVIAPLIGALKQYQEEIKSARKDGKNTDLSDIKTRMLSIGTFFNEIFQAIAKASGYYVNLTLTHEKDSFKDDKKTHILKIVDSAAIYQQVKPYMFRPITGDGSSLSVNVNGELPNNEVSFAILEGTGPGSMTSAAQSKKQEEIKQQLQKSRAEAYAKLNNTSVNDDPPGVYAKIAESNFSQEACSAAAATLSDYKRLVIPTAWEDGIGWTEYFDIELSAEIEGVFPIIVGNRVTCEGLPPYHTVEKKMCFVVLDVTDDINAPGVWTTSIKARLCHL